MRISTVTTIAFLVVAGAAGCDVALTDNAADTCAAVAAS